MKEPTDIGLNRTGVATSPIDSKDMAEFAEQRGPSSPGDESGIAQVRAEYNQESGPIGTMPPPASVKGVVQTVVETLKGDKPTVLIDHIGSRLAFERTGTRLYQGVLAKFDARGSFEGGPTRAELVEFTQEEFAHFALLQRSLQALGADPTVMTPSADIAGVEGIGLLQVVNDPRTTLDQALHSLLAAELVDNAGWEMLANLAATLGHNEMAEDFLQALAQEQKHLERVRTWVSRFIVQSAQGELVQEKTEQAA